MCTLAVNEFNAVNGVRKLLFKMLILSPNMQVHSTRMLNLKGYSTGVRKLLPPKNKDCLDFPFEV